jgi:hypothetical protein
MEIKAGEAWLEFYRYRRGDLIPLPHCQVPAYLARFLADKSLMFQLSESVF